MMIKKTSKGKNMTIKRFKNFTEGAAMTDASNFDGMNKKEPENGTRAKGEQDFADEHKMEVTKHPVAGDHQFNGDRREIRK